MRRCINSIRLSYFIKYYEKNIYQARTPFNFMYHLFERYYINYRLIYSNKDKNKLTKRG